MAQPVTVPNPAVTPAVNTPAPAVTPAATTPAPSPSLTPTPRSANRPKLTAKKALGLEATPGKMSKDVVEENRRKFTASNPIVEPAVPTPAALVVTPPAPPVAAAPIPEPAPATPPKIKIGEKEYTEAELLEKLTATPTPAAPAPAQAAPAAPPAPPAPTQEQIAAAEKQFLTNAANSLEAPLTEAEVDTLLGGGKEAVDMLTHIRKHDMATAILQARKGIAQGLDPIMRELFGAMRPLVENHASLARYNAEQQFLSRHKDFSPHVERARAVAEELLKAYPQEVQKLSAEQFIDEVARQTDTILTSEHKRWFPQGNGNWRAQPAPVAPPVVPQPAAVPATPPAPAARAARPPAATLPLGSTPGGAVGWSPKSVAASLRG